MEVEAVGLGAVEFISDDGCGESLRVGTMQAQLVRASRLGRKSKACDGALWGCGDGNHLEMRHGRFAKLVIYHLSRAVEWVEAQG